MRQFVADCELDSDGCLCVRGKNFRYLGTVLRVQAGDAIYVRLLSGVLQPMTVAKIDSSEKTITLQIARQNQVHSLLQTASFLPLRECF